jgi:methylphosphotriester-DNA--protein-cysteine methyltransferase
MNRVDADPARPYRLLAPDGRTYSSAQPGMLGGHRGTRVYGRLDCPTALASIRRGQYVTHRVFFADELAALDAGFRPCGSCLRELYRDWDQDREGFAAARCAQLGA